MGRGGGDYSSENEHFEPKNKGLEDVFSFQTGDFKVPSWFSRVINIFGAWICGLGGTVFFLLTF